MIQCLLIGSILSDGMESELAHYVDIPWVPRAGDSIVTADGLSLVIESVELNLKTNATTIYLRGIEEPTDDRHSKVASRLRDDGWEVETNVFGAVEGEG